MPLHTKRMGGTEDEPCSLEVEGWLSPASTLLFYLHMLPGVKVVAKKSWVITDDFEAYFLYKGRLFIVQTPMVDLWVSLMGQPPDNELFAEVESHIQGFNPWFYFLAPVAIVLFFFFPANPSRGLLQAHGINPSKWWGKKDAL